MIINQILNLRRESSDNRKFWKTIKPFFSNKGLNSNTLMLKENNRLIAAEKELATVMNTFFVNITESLDLKKDDDSLNPINIKDINNILEKHKHHPSVHVINRAFMTNEKFSFKFVTEDLVRAEVVNLNGSKATATGDISVDVLKSNVDIHLPYITNNINLLIKKVVFLKNLSLLKLAQSSKRKMT